MDPMNGADALVKTLLAAGVDTCFANPGTSEMHFVAALDREPAMACVLCLFEGVVTGAADGYARMADKPAATLLHLGPGLANGLANLHNAKRARTPVVNIVGDHATYHRIHDAPLTADVEGTARPYSDWVRTARTAHDVGPDGAAAVAAALAPPGRVATLILPADTAWTESERGPASPEPREAPRAVPAERVEAMAALLRSGEPCALLVTGKALRAHGLETAARIAAATGCRLMAPTNNARIERGAGRVPITRLPYPVDDAVAFLSGLRHLILVGAQAPAIFFAYPGKPGVPTPPDCGIHTLAAPGDDTVAALEALEAALNAGSQAIEVVRRDPAPPPDGSAITLERLADSVRALLPENAIVVDEGISASATFYKGLREAAAHDWLHITGGAIGVGLPLATGAAVACRDRKVVCLQADGSALYTVQALWTMARENLDVTTVIFDNRTYATLIGELAKVGAGNAGRRALDMMSLDRPAIGWAELARSFGVEGTRVETLDDFNAAFRAAIGRRGPSLIAVAV
jgi:acetolactate synthase-1/2/3 large subunit